LQSNKTETLLAVEGLAIFIFNTCSFRVC